MLVIILKGEFKLSKNVNRKHFRYFVLKALEEGKESRLNEPGISLDLRDEYLLDMQEEGLIKGLKATKDRVAGHPKITLLGEQYLSDNNKLNKAYNVAKEVRDWLPFLYN